MKQETIKGFKSHDDWYSFCKHYYLPTSTQAAWDAGKREGNNHDCRILQSECDRLRSELDDCMGVIR